MSDDESFVILGTSPNASMDTRSLTKDSVHLQKPSSQLSSLNGEFPIVNGGTVMVTSDASSSTGSAESNKFSIIHNPPKNAEAQNADDAGVYENIPISLNNSIMTQKSLSGSLQLSDTPPKTPSLTTDQGSMATSFLLGEVAPDVLKKSVYSQFPSLCSNTSNSSDLAKLQSLMSEYMELKDALRKANVTMRQYFTTSQKWQEDIKKMDVEHKQQIKECQETIAKLRNENLELRRDLDLKIEQIDLHGSAMKRENADLVKLVSEKTAQIQNMSAQIEKIEQQQLQSFDVIQKAQSSGEQPFHDYVPSAEHERIVKDLQRQMSALLAENLELKDMQKQYIDEIDCLKVNFVSLEELFKKSQNDICVLKNQNAVKSDSFEEYKKTIDALSQEVQLLRAQVDVYSKDFEIERSSRQTLAGEKDQLLSDLRILQRKNQTLIEEAQARIEQAVSSNTSSSSSTSSFSRRRQNSPKTQSTSTSAEPKQTQTEEQVYTPTKYFCPLCNATYGNLNSLQDHVQACLDSA